MKKILSYAIAVMMVLSLVGGNGITVSAKTKKKPKMSASKITMTVGQKKTLKLKNYGKISKKEIKKVEWSTSNKSVATVKASGKYRQQGKITAKKAGEATVKLKYNGKIYKCKVTVKSKENKTTEQKTTEDKKTEQSNTDKKTVEEKKTEQPDTEKTTEKKTEQPDTEKTTEKSTGQSTEKPEKPVCSHIWDEGILSRAATCTEDGAMIYMCTKCKEKKIQAIAAFGHSWNSGTVIKKADCITEGIKEYSCLRCGDKKAESLPVNDMHTDSTEYTVDAMPTCGSKGQKSVHCTKCNKIISGSEEVIPATGNHNYNNGMVTREATCAQNGVRTYACTVCGNIKTESIPKLTTHTYDDTYTVDNVSTYTTQGSKSHHCTLCGRSDGNYVDIDFADTYSRYTRSDLLHDKWSPMGNTYLGGMPDRMGGNVIAYLHDNEYYMVMLGNFAYDDSKDFTVEIYRGNSAGDGSQRLQRLSFSYDEAIEIYKRYNDSYMGSNCYEYWKDRLTAERSLVIDSEGVLNKKQLLFVSSELLYKILCTSDYKPDFNTGFRNLSCIGWSASELFNIY